MSRSGSLHRFKSGFCIADLKHLSVLAVVRYCRWVEASRCLCNPSTSPYLCISDTNFLKMSVFIARSKVVLPCLCRTISRPRPQWGSIQSRMENVPSNCRTRRIATSQELATQYEAHWRYSDASQDPARLVNVVCTLTIAHPTGSHAPTHR